MKIPTPNPDEYFLCEVRIKEGFERMLTKGEERGGVVFWHVDESVNREWFLKAQCVSSNRPGGRRHDLGNALLPREGFETVHNGDGSFYKFGPLWDKDRAEKDPFFYKSGDEKTFLFDSSLYCGAASMSYSLNKFPEGVSPDWKLTVEVLDEPAEKMRVKIKRG